jgi:hypothetical protein
MMTTTIINPMTLTMKRNHNHHGGVSTFVVMENVAVLGKISISFRDILTLTGSWKAELEQEAQTHVLMTFLYVWTILLVIILAIFVNRNFNLGRLKSVRWFLLAFLNYALICSAMIGGIPQLIKDGGEELEDIGWYGQMSVLTFLSCVSEMISSLVLTCWIGRLIQKQRYELEKEEKSEYPYAFY